MLREDPKGNLAPCAFPAPEAGMQPTSPSALQRPLCVSPVAAVTNQHKFSGLEQHKRIISHTRPEVLNPGEGSLVLP